MTQGCYCHFYAGFRLITDRRFDVYSAANKVRTSPPRNHPTMARKVTVFSLWDNLKAVTYFVSTWGSLTIAWNCVQNFWTNVYARPRSALLKANEKIIRDPQGVNLELYWVTIPFVNDNSVRFPFESVYFIVRIK